MEIQGSSGSEARVEELLRHAHIHRMRRQWIAAETLCREALALDPEDPIGQELLADLLREKGSIDEALELYQKAFEKQPHKGTLEEKIARLILEKAEEERGRIEAELLLHSPREKGRRKRSVTLAMLLSLLCPGAGQFFNGQYVKGWICLVAGLVALFLGVPELFKLVFLIAGGSLERGAAPPNQFLATLGVMGVLVYLYSLLDASAQAGKSAHPSMDV